MGVNIYVANIQLCVMTFVEFIEDMFVKSLRNLCTSFLELNLRKKVCKLHG